MEIPTWVTTSVGIFSLLGSAFMLLLLVMVGIVIAHSLTLSKHIKRISAQIEQVTEKGKGIAEKVDSVTTEIGSRATGIARLVDERVEPAMRAVELAAPALFIVAAFIKLRGALSGRKRRR
ncbi:MAG: hypothetical protein KIT11_02415 [Fimbriimonadaceae bacterium]|nr:hypothetical protein [Fimbriimonadaceae bacterium]QYK54778.1 MAG: hypothetical protein KF733_07120 [Fimbriimonadaceae bacterium]